MITFQEREPFESSGSFGPTKQTLVPVYMIMDDAEYFVANISMKGGNYGEKYAREKMEGYKAQLSETEGRYFKFNGMYDSPEDMISEMISRGHTFVKNHSKDELFLISPAGHYGAGFIDFSGNRNEVSAAFHYRIYCREYYAKICELTRPIVEKKRG